MLAYEHKIRQSCIHSSANMYILIVCIVFFLSEEMKTLLNPEYLEHDA